MRVARSTKEIEDLAARMAASEDEAYAEFANTFGPRFRALFIKRGLAISDAEDLAVSCVTDTALKIEKYRASGRGGFEAWVFTVARNYLVDWIRTKKNSEPLPDTLASPEPTDSETETEPDAEIAIAVADAFVQLSGDDQTIVRLRHLIEEHTYSEIGEQVGISPEAARVRHFRALKRLKAILEKDDRIIRRLRPHKK